MIFRLALLILLLSFLPARAEEQARSVQEELRRRNIYFGDVDGRRTPELSEAVKRYQRRKGFSATGQEDQETLRSLALAPRAPGEAPPKELEWPEEPVLKSDVKIDVAVEVAHIAEETGVAPETIAVGEIKRPPSKPLTKPPSSKAANARSGASPSTVRTAAASPKITERELRTFVGAYLRSLGSDDLRSELRFYADRVKYFANGEVDRRIVERTLRAYYQRWPKQSYSLAGPMEYAFLPETGEFVVSFRVAFSLKNGQRTVKGQTENRVIINATTADPRIVKIEERRIRG